MKIGVSHHPQFPGIFRVVLEDGSQRLATASLSPGRNVYGERLIHDSGTEYRVWDPFRSKLAAAILKGLNVVPIGLGSQVLYLGAASGTTASHVSDIVGDSGCVYCVEFAPRSIRELVDNVTAYRVNMIPILEDARKPEVYAMFVRGRINTVYCDVAQPEQAKILADNADAFLEESGWAMLAVKAQSIDVTKEPAIIFKSESRVLENRGFRIEHMVGLEPYDKAHVMIVAQRQYLRSRK